MTTPDLVGLFVEPLERIGTTYMITGGVATVVYGDPRFTRDIDIVLALDPSGIPPVRAAFDGDDFYLPPQEAMASEVARPEGGHFNIIHRETALRADVYLVGDDPLHAWALEHRRRLELETTPVWLAPLEYVILRKLQYYRSSSSDRHLRDVAMMLRISGDLLDQDALDEWLGRLSLTETYQQARGYVPMD